MQCELMPIIELAAVQYNNKDTPTMSLQVPLAVENIKGHQELWLSL